MIVLKLDYSLWSWEVIVLKLVCDECGLTTEVRVRQPEPDEAREVWRKEVVGPAVLQAHVALRPECPCQQWSVTVVANLSATELEKEEELKRRRKRFFFGNQRQS